MTDVPELKGCPFCGCTKLSIGNDGLCSVGCHKCGTEGPSTISDDLAIEAWNRRHLVQEGRAAWQEEREKLIAERDEAVNWSDIVDRYGTDQFDDLAEAWLGLEAIQRVTSAATSTFAKWANDDLMSSFRQQQLSMFHMAFVEGCLVGAKAAEARAALALLAAFPRSTPVTDVPALKLCPFCGSTDGPVLRSSSAHSMSWVSCVSCGLEAPTETGVSEQDAVTYWNTRAHLVQEGLAVWQEEREKLTRLVRDAYNEAFIEGAKEHTPKGGKPWSESRARRALSGDAT